jgi:hypothetical protein
VVGEDEGFHRGSMFVEVRAVLAEGVPKKAH